LEFLRPVDLGEVAGLHRQSLANIRVLAICLAILAPCGPVYLLCEQVEASRALIALPIHIAVYVAIALLAKSDFGFRHTTALLVAVTLALTVDLTFGSTWTTPGFSGGQIAVLAVHTPMLVGLFVPWRPTVILGFAAPTIGAALLAHVVFEIPLLLPTATVVAATLSVALCTAMAVQSQRRLWLRLERSVNVASAAENEARSVSRESAARAADIRRILDNVADGFLIITPDGRMSRERSAILSRWFGDVPDNSRFLDMLRGVDSSQAEVFDASWGQLIDDVLPLEVAIAQLPTRVVAGNRTLEISYHPVLHGERLREVVATVSDVTAELERERAEAELTTVFAAFKCVVKDREGFTGFVREASRLVTEITHGELPRAGLLRQLHTLKGNAATYDLEALSRLCHDLETRLLDEGDGALSAAESARLVSLWQPIAGLLDAQVGSARSSLEVTDVEHADAVRRLLEGAPRAEVAAQLQGWRLEPTRSVLTRLAAQAESTAVRLEKNAIAVVIADHGVRLPRDRWAPFWSALVHVMRNAVDHGIEGADERVRLGKPANGTIRLATSLDEGALVVEVADDGRGIDWTMIRERARAHGEPADSRSDLERALFEPGISSRTEVTEISGRGVGMSAVRDACTALGGAIEVESREGLGTKLVFRFPSARPLAAAA
jgi:signal transduction histidine kinase